MSETELTVRPPSGLLETNLNPFGHSVCLSYPLRTTSNAWLVHVPFGMFLIDLLKPNTLVELGTYSGVSYCSFCQAVKELALETRCYAVDTWQGDAHSGNYGPEVLAELRQYHDPLYGHFSQLTQSTFDEALGRFKNKSVDLLHIDGLHTYDAVKHDFESWLPKLSDQGVVLFHDICVSQKDFGVWKFWEELKTQYPHFEIRQKYGIGVLAVGQSIPLGFKSLLESSEGVQAEIKVFFERLGTRVEAMAEEQETTSVQRARIGELEEFVGRVQRNPFFKIYHWIKYLGKT